MPTQRDGTITAARFPLPYMLERGTYCSLTLDVKGVIPGVATVTTTGTDLTGADPTFVVTNSAGAVLLSEAVNSPSSSTHTFDVPATWQLGPDYLIEWSYRVNLGGGRYERKTFRNEAIVVRRVLYCPISDNDVYAVCSSLDPNASKPIHGLTSLNQYVNQAWTRIERRLLEQGNRPNLVMSPSAFHDVAVLLSLALVFEDFATRLNAAYMEQARLYREQYETAWSRLSFKYAPADGTTADGTRRKSATSSIFLGTSRGR